MLNNKDRTIIKNLFKNKTFLLVILIFFVGFSSPAFAKKKKTSKSKIKISQITVGMDTIPTNSSQLLEVSVVSSLEKDTRVKVKLLLTLPNRNMITFGNKSILLKTKTETRVLFPYWVKKKSAGDYTVAARIYTMSGKLIMQSSPEKEQYFFAVDPNRKNFTPKRRRGLKVSSKDKIKLKSQMVAEKAIMEQPVKFDPPDLEWELVQVIQPSIIRGEVAHLKLVLVNKGGDVAEGAEYTGYWSFSQRPGRKIQFVRETIKFIAPGERKQVVIPITIPADQQKGRYLVEVKVDENDRVKESNEENNVKSSSNDINFGDIALIFPDDSYSFAEEGLFQFEWRSGNYNQFKLQVSADPSFAKREEMFELPKGEGKWTPSTQINPLPGEMPTMATGLMQNNAMDHLFWRIIAKNSQGQTTESRGRKFYINLKPEINEEAEPVEKIQ